MSKIQGMKATEFFQLSIFNRGDDKNLTGTHGKEPVGHTWPCAVTPPASRTWGTRGGGFKLHEAVPGALDAR